MRKITLNTSVFLVQKYLKLLIFVYKAVNDRKKSTKSNCKLNAYKTKILYKSKTIYVQICKHNKVNYAKYFLFKKYIFKVLIKCLVKLLNIYL